MTFEMNKYGGWFIKNPTLILRITWQILSWHKINIWNIFCYRNTKVPNILIFKHDKGDNIQ